MDNRIRHTLIEVCELALETTPGFQWLTHTVNYGLFPESLVVVCVFETNMQRDQARCLNLDTALSQLIKEKLLAIDVKLNNIQQIRFDTEENCQRDNNGKWHQRLG